METAMIKILGMPYKIEYVDSVDKYELKYGEINYFDNTIRIDRTLTEEKKKVTVIHEVLHGICDALGYDELNDNESMIQGLATALYSTFKHTSIFS